MKRFIVLFLVVLMSVESFAAVVSDNDGGAFITNKTTAKMIQPIKSFNIYSFFISIINI